MYPSSEAPSVMVLDRNTTRGLGDEQGSKEYTFLKRDYEIKKSKGVTSLAFAQVFIEASCDSLRHLLHWQSHSELYPNSYTSPFHNLTFYCLSLWAEKIYRRHQVCKLDLAPVIQADVHYLGLSSSFVFSYWVLGPLKMDIDLLVQKNEDVSWPKISTSVAVTSVEVHQPEGDSTTSGPTAQDRSAFSYKVIKLRDVKVVPRFIGERGDVVVITFKDDTKVDPRSVPQFREIAKYCLSAAEKPVDLTPVSGPTGRAKTLESS
ncbi:hypothetical protein POTOM_030147 [Populus tomentosa]|uniref:Uncharacterized protein n=1 Tax=Populus tomentosa TaxID=118781 RepID=A0A8X7ZEF4_POPTO|nr:hypothetical protein POTOM_030147 [Populus tomentosa]